MLRTNGEHEALVGGPMDPFGFGGVRARWRQGGRWLDQGSVTGGGGGPGVSVEGGERPSRRLASGGGRLDKGSVQDVEKHEREACQGVGA